MEQVEESDVPHLMNSKRVFGTIQVDAVNCFDNFTGSIMPQFRQSSAAADAFDYNEEPFGVFDNTFDEKEFVTLLGNTM